MAACWEVLGGSKATHVDCESRERVESISSWSHPMDKTEISSLVAKYFVGIDGRMKD